MAEVHPEKVIDEMEIKKMKDDTKVRRGHDLRTKRRKSLVPARSHVIEIDLEVEIIHVVATTEDGLDPAQSADQKRSPFLTYARE